MIQNLIDWCWWDAFLVCDIFLLSTNSCLLTTKDFLHSKYFIERFWFFCSDLASIFLMFDSSTIGCSHKTYKSSLAPESLNLTLHQVSLSSGSFNQKKSIRAKNLWKSSPATRIYLSNQKQTKHGIIIHGVTWWRFNNNLIFATFPRTWIFES